MPARTNDFQKLVYLMRHNLAGESTVTESKMLTDLVAGDQVEVDVCVEGQVDGDRVNICIECRDRSRKADKNWVHEMKAKHDRLPTNVLVLASSKGFTKKAIELARSYGIQTVTLEEVEDDQFPAALSGQMLLWAKSISVAAQRVIFVVEASQDFPAERVGAVPNQHIFDGDGINQLTAAQLVATFLNAPETQNHMLREVKPEHVWFRLEWETLGTSPMYLQKLQPSMLRQISKVIVEGPCSLTLNGLRLRRGKIGSTQVAWGKTLILGRDATVVATRDAGGLEKMSIHLSAASLKDSIPTAEDVPEGSQAGYRVSS